MNTNNQNENKPQNEFKEKLLKFISNVRDETDTFTKEEIEAGTAMALFSYLFILSLIPYFTQKNNKYTYYHAKQGINLFIMELLVGCGVGFVTSLLFPLSPINGLIDSVMLLIFLGFSGIGIYNVYTGKARELPILNAYKVVK